MTAKQKGNDWYVWNDQWGCPFYRSEPSALKDNVSYQATIFKDAPNSYEQPKEYMVEKRTVDNKTILNIDMAKAVDRAIRLEAEN